MGVDNSEFDLPTSVTNIFCLGTKVQRHGAGIIGRWYALPLVARHTQYYCKHAHKKYKKEILAHSQRAIAKVYKNMNNVKIDSS